MSAHFLAYRETENYVQLKNARKESETAQEARKTMMQIVKQIKKHSPLTKVESRSSPSVFDIYSHSPFPSNTRLATFMTVMISHIKTARIVVYHALANFTDPCTAGDGSCGLVKEPFSMAMRKRALPGWAVMYLLRQVK